MPRTAHLTIGHSPDPDDAFMWWPLGDAARGAEPVIDTEGLAFTAVPCDIESLNRRAAETADLDVTALSVRAYPDVRSAYILAACGGSFGDGYGPKIVALPETVAGRPPGGAWLRDPAVRVAIPGVRTSAYLALRLAVGGDVNAVETPFERIIEAVCAGEVEAGVVIHEGQLTYADAGLELVADLGAWWGGETGLPLPLGGNAVRRDLDARCGPGTAQRLARVLRRSVEYALRERSAGLDYALTFARGLARDRADTFVSMYVNDLTVDAGERGRRAIQAFLDRGAAAGLCREPGQVDFLAPDR